MILECPASVVLVNNLLVNTLAATYLTQYFSNLLRMFVLINSGSRLNMIETGSKKRSLCQILEKSCLRSRGNIFCLIFLKLTQDFYIDCISVKFDHGSGGVKHRSLGQILEKSCVHSRGHSFGTIFLKLAKDVYIDNISVKVDREWGWVKK